MVHPAFSYCYVLSIQIFCNLGAILLISIVDRYRSCSDQPSVIELSFIAGTQIQDMNGYSLLWSTIINGPAVESENRMLTTFLSFLSIHSIIQNANNQISDAYITNPFELSS